MKEFLRKIHKQAKRNPQTIVFPEHMDPRIRKAVHVIAQKKIAKPILLTAGHKQISGIRTVNVQDAELQNYYAREMHRIRKRKGWSLGKCKGLITNEMYFGTMMVATGSADGLISGAAHSTAETMRPALQLIKTRKRFHKVSGLFLMLLEKKLYLFADCAVNIDPTAKELAEIAIDSAHTAKELGIEPRIAMLSFSTFGSAQHPQLDKIRRAVKLVKKKHPRLMIEGEMQVDAALVPFVAKIKAPKSKLRGRANVLIFPDLNSGNISYKLVQRLGGVKAIGPITQGLQKPVNDLSEGCSVEDIVNLAAITCVHAQKK